MNRFLTVLFFSSVLLAACKHDPREEATYSKTKQLQAVVVEPAGTATPLQYNAKTGAFEPEQEAGHDRLVRFLPFPANHGFIPGTLLDSARGGNGQPLEMMLLSPVCTTGTLLEVQPLALVTGSYNNRRIPMIIAVPAKPSERTLDANNLEQFEKRYPAAKQIISLWLRNAEGRPGLNELQWHSEQAAEKEIQRWMK
jgi:inorganic pyrophosphatase